MEHNGISARNGYPGRYSLPGYPGIFIIRLRSSPLNNACRYGCEICVIYGVYHEFNVNLRSDCKYETV